MASGTISFISIHAPTRGATGFSGVQPNTVIISIHAPTRGATLKPLPRLYNPLFQSTLLQEERLLSRLSSTALIKISIHAPTRGATTAR